MLSWNKIDGASGYIIRRGAYSYSDISSLDMADSYYYDEESGKLSVNETEVSSSRATVVLNNGVYTLTDYDAETTAQDTDGDYAYQLNQAKISWGIPFGYEVLPVKEAADFSFDGFSISGAIAYSNNSPVKGAAYGYGLKLMAAKASNNKKQSLSWSLPYNSDKSPVVYYREASSTENTWTKLATTATAGSTTASFVPVDLDEAYEYIVAYGKSANTISLPSSFLSELQSDIDSEYDYEALGKTEEPANKGYLLYVDFEAKCGGENSSSSDDDYYSELLSWSAWDYDKRSIGPDSAAIKILNKNLTDGWIEVAELNTSCEVSSNNTLTNTIVSGDGTQLLLKPEKLSGEDDMVITIGPLKVLRDYKHYYQLVLTRGTSSFGIGDDESIYAYRQISDAELVKCISLIFADAINQSGISSGGDRTCQGENGTFTITHASASKTIEWGTNGNDYKHIFRSGVPYNTESSFNSAWTVNMAQTSSRSSVDSTKLYYLPEQTINVSHECGLSSYSGTVSITVGETGYKGWTVLSDGVTTSYVGAFKANGSTIKTISDSSETELKKWFPFELAADKDDKVTAYDSSLTEYNSPWWGD